MFLVVLVVSVRAPDRRRAMDLAIASPHEARPVAARGIGMVMAIGIRSTGVRSMVVAEEMTRRVLRARRRRRRRRRCASRSGSFAPNPIPIPIPIRSMRIPQVER